MDPGEDVSLNVRKFYRQAQNILSQPKDDSEILTVLNCLLCLSSHSSGTKYISQLSQFDIDKTCFVRARDEFKKNHYVNMLEFLVNKFTVDWIAQIPKNPNGIGKLNDLFIEGPPHLALLVLGESISCSGISYRFNKCVDLLERLLFSHVDDLFWYQCQLMSGDLDRQLWPRLVTMVATAPDRVTGKQGTQSSTFFYPAQYVPHICRSIYKCLCRVHDSIKQESSCSVEFLGQLSGKLAITGYKDILWETLLPLIEGHLYSDAIWCRVCERLISNIPDRCLESVLVPLIEHASWYGTIVKFLGDSVLANKKLKFLLTNKLMLVRFYKESKILQNIIGYLSSSPRTKYLLVGTLHSLLDVWGDASALKHTSYEQHLYLSKAIIVCLAFVEDADKNQLKNELLPKLLTSLHCHLESALPKIRSLGMVVAECLTGTLDPEGEQLKFSYDINEDIKQLKELLVKPNDPGISNIQRTNSQEKMETKTEDIVTEHKTESEESEELDSDDDLEPYDISEDAKVTKFKVPVYLRECMEGLISSDEPERVEVCITKAESLIYKHPASASEIAVEFARVLLYLQDNYALPGFGVARHRAMVALTCVAPQKVAEYLTKEFYARNYNIRQRLDMLEVLAAAAQKLSNPAESTSEDSHGHSSLLIQEVKEERSEPQSWREIVDKRIESKTRRFAKGRQSAAPVETANRFAPVAGYFFFPLLQVFERRDDGFDILGEDHLLLTRLCYTLGIIMYAALNAPIVRQMSKALVEFIWMLRYHTQPAVRQALLFAVSMMLLAVPSHILFSDLQTEMIEMKYWIEDVIGNDSDNDCRQLAVQAMVLLTKALKQEFGSPGEAS